MPGPLNSGALLGFLARRGEAWIVGQRERYRPRGRPLSDEEDAHLARFFEDRTRRSVRIARVPSLDNPTFYRELGQIVLDFTRMAAITFVDTVVLNDRYVDETVPLPIVLHEMVHVVQYEVLGVGEFARRYVAGWAQAGFSYPDIPLERMAYRLGAELEAGTLAGTVNTAVAAELSASVPGGRDAGGD